MSEFELRAPVFGHPPPKETRSQAWHRLALVRQSTMRQRHGAGPDGQTCKGCVHLKRVGHHDGSYLKCGLFRISSSEATDWRAKWPACGAYRSKESTT